MAEANDDGRDNTVEIIRADGQHLKLSFSTSSGTVRVGRVSESSAAAFRRSSSEYVAQAIDVLWTEVEGDSLRLSFLGRKRSRSEKLVQIEGRLLSAELGDQWCKEVMAAAYNGIKRNRRLRVLVNPYGGRGQARCIFTKKVEPMLQAARCDYSTTFTEHPRHAYEIAKELPLEYDAVVVLSGDGLVHEVLNGFGDHQQPTDAFAVPIAHVPTGSGNALSINLLGLEDGFDVRVATMNAIKGRPMKADVCSVRQGTERFYSFLSQACGLIAESDIGTDHLRWMGDRRFMYGFLRGLIKFKECPVTLYIKVDEQDKNKMLQTLKMAQSLESTHPGEANADTDQIRTAPPPAAFPSEPSKGEQWISFDRPILYFSAGKGPFVGRDLMQFPVSLPSDGLVDIVVQEFTNRAHILRGIDGAENGEPFWLSSHHYFKARAYCVVPRSSESVLSIDGEAYPFVPYEVNVHQGLATFLSPHGTYVRNPKFGKQVKKKGASV